jgi:DNA modification methylase
MVNSVLIVAAIKENRQYIGIEKDEHYFDIANERIAAETSQLSLF